MSNKQKKNKVPRAGGHTGSLPPPPPPPPLRCCCCAAAGAAAVSLLLEGLRRRPRQVPSKRKGGGGGPSTFPRNRLLCTALPSTLLPNKARPPTCCASQSKNERRLEQKQARAKEAAQQRKGKNKLMEVRGR